MEHTQFYLPYELIQIITNNLSNQDKASLSLVSKYLHKIIAFPRLSTDEKKIMFRKELIVIAQQIADLARILYHTNNKRQHLIDSISKLEINKKFLIECHKDIYNGVYNINQNMHAEGMFKDILRKHGHKIGRDENWMLKHVFSFKCINEWHEFSYHIDIDQNFVVGFEFEYYCELEYCMCCQIIINSPHKIILVIKEDIDDLMGYQGITMDYYNFNQNHERVAFAEFTRDDYWKEAETWIGDELSNSHELVKFIATKYVI